MADPIKCTGSVYKVQTLVDFGFRVSIDLPQTDIMPAAAFMECKQLSVALDIQATPITQNSSKPNDAEGKKQRPEIKSLRGS